MSDPTRRHVHDPRAAGLFVPGRFVEMRCDGGAIAPCKNTPQRGARLMVPPLGHQFPYPPGLEPIRRFTVLHFCERHKGQCTIGLLLGEPNCKAIIERAAKRRWPHGTLPDFDKAAIEWLLTTTPDYRDFLERIERNLIAQPELMLL
jgi:hypothetical protein